MAGAVLINADASIHSVPTTKNPSTHPMQCGAHCAALRLEEHGARGGLVGGGLTGQLTQLGLAQRARGLDRLGQEGKHAVIRDRTTTSSE
jgi:hypothetical protein